MAGKVFISHAAEDTGRCAPLVRAFSAWDVDVWFAAQETAAGQQLSRQEQEALAAASVLLRICTRATARSYWMSLETGAFLGLQADERRAGGNTRRVVNLILDPAYAREPFDRTATIVDAAGGKNAQWVDELRAALGLSPLAAPSSLSTELFPPARGISRRQALATGIGTAAVVVATVGVGGALWIARPRHTVLAGPTPTPTPPVQSARLRWSRRVKSPNVYGDSTGISAAPLVANGQIYLGSQDGNFAAFDTTGALTWSKQGYSGGIWRQAAATTGLVLFAADGTGIVACDAVTGVTRWSGGPAFDFTELTVSDGVLYVSAYKYGGFVDTLNLSDGAEIVSFHPTDNSAIPTSPPLIIAGTTAGTLYIAADDGYLYALDASQPGPERWKADVGATKARLTGQKVYSITRPALDSTLGLLYVGSDDTNIYAVDAQTGAVRWRYATGDMVRSYPAVSGGTVFAGSEDRFIYALDAATGTLKWRTQTGGAVLSPPLVANNLVYAGSRDSSVYALDPSTGAIVTKYPTSGPVVSQPVIADGVLYITSLDGYLYAYLP